MDFTLKKEYSAEAVDFAALIDLHSTKLRSGKELYNDFMKLPIKRDFLLFTYTSKEEVRKDYWPILIDGLLKYSSNPAANAIWSTLFVKKDNSSEEQDFCEDVNAKPVGDNTQELLLFKYED